MRIRMLRGTGHNGQSLDPGTEHEVDDKTARIFIQLGKAYRVEAPGAAAADVVETREPTAETRDPLIAPPRPGRVARGR